MRSLLRGSLNLIKADTALINFAYHDMAGITNHHRMKMWNSWKCLSPILGSSVETYIIQTGMYQICYSEVSMTAYLTVRSVHGFLHKIVTTNQNPNAPYEVETCRIYEDENCQSQPSVGKKCSSFLLIKCRSCSSILKTSRQHQNCMRLRHIRVFTC